MRLINATFKAAITLIAVALSISAQATGGKLNSSGCHNSKKVGYHCHRAQPTQKPVNSTAPKKKQTS